jgi:DNA-directed RNA polymerase specialized sigma24 family protein
LTPIIQHRVSRALSVCRVRRASGSHQRSDLLDLTQQMLLLLFEERGKALSSWHPERGLSLNNFVGLVAEREALAVLRSGRRSAWAETPTADDILSAYRDESESENVVSARDELISIWHRLEGQLSPRGIALFRALLVDELPIEKVCQTFQMSATAVYNFRSRLRHRVREIRASLTAAEGVSLAQLRAVGAQGSRWSLRDTG